MRYIVWTEDPGEIWVEFVREDYEDKRDYCWVYDCLQMACTHGSMVVGWVKDPDEAWKTQLLDLVNQIRKSRDANLLFARTKEDR